MGNFSFSIPSVFVEPIKQLSSITVYSIFASSTGFLVAEFATAIVTLPLVLASQSSDLSEKEAISNGTKSAGIGLLFLMLPSRNKLKVYPWPLKANGSFTSTKTGNDRNNKP